MGFLSSTVFDVAGQVVRAIDQLSNRTSYQYDANGNQTTITDANSMVSSSIYQANSKSPRRALMPQALDEFLVQPGGRTDKRSECQRICEFSNSGSGFQGSGALQDALSNYVTTRDIAGRKIAVTDS